MKTYKRLRRPAVLSLSLPLLPLLIAIVALSQNVDPKIAAGFNAIRERNLRADLTFLASDALEGRMSLQRGSEVAINFIAAEFDRAGLKPLTGDSYLQPVELIEYRADPRAMGLKLMRGGHEESYESPRDFIGGFPIEMTVSAPVVFAGYGVTAPEFGYDDYKDLDAKGKIVLIFDHEPQENDPKSVFNGLGNTRHANSRLKILNAQRHGAVGVLMVSEPNRTHPSNQERMARIPRTARTPLPSQALADSETKIPLLVVSDTLAGRLLEPAGKKPGELQSAIDASLQGQSQALADTTVEMRVVNGEHRRGVSYNVIGMIEGSDPQLKNETIVFSGHYDHDGIRDGQIFHGADDNGSGTAGVIELARAFASNPAKPKRSLLFAVFAAEERGLLGSYFYVAHPLRPLQTTRAVINFDMIGRNETPSAQTEGLIEIAADTSNELNLIGVINSPDYRDVVERENARVGLKLNYKWDNDAALNVFQRSDQFPFALRDIPAMWWFTGFHPDYHQTTDTVEKINFAKMEKILKLAYLSGWAFADGANAPRFVSKPQG
ncbi:MAG: M28 family peptidase [Chloracidobacterium sp.]|nr:M28 family peptidase [Chloracidobacterium sp.]